MITLGTGVGSGIVVDGRVVYGSDGFAGELGHFVIDHSDNARSCGCGRKGCLEAYTSATGVARTAREFLEHSSEASLLRDLVADEITSYDVFKAAERVTSWHWIYSIIQVAYWVQLVRTLPLSALPKPLYSSVD